MPVQNIKSDKQGDAEPCVLHRDFLHRGNVSRPPQIQETADLAGANAARYLRLPRTGPVTAYPAATILSWPIFSSRVIAVSSLSIRIHRGPDPV